MRVLFIAEKCSLHDEPGNMDLVQRHEYLLSQYANDRVTLAVVYFSDDNEKYMVKNGVAYYPVHGKMNIGISDAEWENTAKLILQVIDDFHPDIIHSFGSEHPHARIAEKTNVPVVVHMMGFLNIYYPSNEMAHGHQSDRVIPNCSWKRKWILRLFFRDWLRLQKQSEDGNRRTSELIAQTSDVERMVMKNNRYFFGRTEWDRNIVRYYSPSGKYFYLEEAVKASIYNNLGTWKYHAGKTIRLLTISSADDRKGNEIILRTAQVLKELLGLSFEWRVAGSRDFFPLFEKRCGISHEDVNIQLIGRINDERIIEEIQHADFFIHPSIMDNSPHAVYEAQIIGCPVIASNVGGVPNLVEHGVTGFLYPYNEPHTLAFLVANHYASQDELTRISEAEVSLSKIRFEPNSLAASYVSSYQAIIDDNHTRQNGEDI